MGREIITIFGFKKPSQTEFWLMVEEDANQQPPSPLSLSFSKRVEFLGEKDKEG